MLYVSCTWKLQVSIMWKCDLIEKNEFQFRNQHQKLTQKSQFATPMIKKSFILLTSAINRTVTHEARAYLQILSQKMVQTNGYMLHTSWRVGWEECSDVTWKNGPIPYGLVRNFCARNIRWPPEDLLQRRPFRSTIKLPLCWFVAVYAKLHLSVLTGISSPPSAYYCHIYVYTHFAYLPQDTWKVRWT